jgi:oligopeptide/dipeptide ABC transporter ATP-binding protein
MSASMKDGHLEATDASVVFRSGFGDRNAKTALKNASLGIGGPEARIIAIVGESGSGKTTLTHLLLGFRAPTAGTVTYRGIDVARMNSAERGVFRREVQAVFQDPFEAFNPFYRVDHALFTPLAVFGIARDKAEARAKIETALETVGLRPAETLGKYPHQLSGGQRQRIMITRALLLDPHIILADEPVSMVDASLRSTILQTLLKLKDEAGISIVYVTHDLTTAYQIADTVVVLYAGAIVESGTAEAVIGAPRHPYTRLLIDAIPSTDIDTPWNLNAVDPDEGNLRFPATGCAFAPRCARATSACVSAEPVLAETEPGRLVRCIRPLEFP